jgi:hypothetical protein
LPRLQTSDQKTTIPARNGGISGDDRRQDETLAVMHPVCLLRIGQDTEQVSGRRSAPLS